MTRICLTILITLLTACASQQQTKSQLANYVGRNIESAISELGRPSQVRDMGDGTIEYVWKRESRSTTTANTSVMGIPLSKALGSKCVKPLIADQTRRVVSHRIFGC